jgi:hypothetical protein
MKGIMAGIIARLRSAPAEAVTVRRPFMACWQSMTQVGLPARSPGTAGPATTG